MSENEASRVVVISTPRVVEALLSPPYEAGLKGAVSLELSRITRCPMANGPRPSAPLRGSTASWWSSAPTAARRSIALAWAAVLPATWPVSWRLDLHARTFRSCRFPRRCSGAGRRERGRKDRGQSSRVARIWSAPSTSRVWSGSTPEVLSSLTMREFGVAGMAEVIKYGAIWDARVLRVAREERAAGSIEDWTPKLITHAPSHAPVAIKAEDRGPRRARGRAACLAQLRTHAGTRDRERRGLPQA